MTEFLIILLLVVGGLLAWVVKLLLSMPSSGNREIGAPDDSRFSAMLEQTGHNEDTDVLNVADQLLERIDSRIEILKRLIAEADRKIERMQQDGYLLPAENPYPEAEGTTRGTGKDKILEDETRAKIIALRRKGVAAATIAREVEMGLGEIELILKIEGYS